MQRTRLNLLLKETNLKVDLFFINPWRRIALILISFFFGTFMGGTIPTTAGQSSVIDLFLAIILITITESISLFIYSRKKIKKLNEQDNSIFIYVLNSLKIGLTFGLYLEAVKLAT